MNKRLAASLSLIFISMLILPSFALSQDDAGDEIVDEETSEEIKAMVTSQGAKARMLQLEKAVNRGVLMAQAIIDEIEETNESFDTSDIELIVEEMNLLLEEISSVDTEGETDDVVRQFVDLKKDAIDLARRFRENARNAFGAGELAEIRNRVRNVTHDELAELGERIRNAILEHNAERIQAALRAMNQSRQDIVNQIRNGNMSKEDIRNEIGNALGTMSREEKTEAIMNMEQNASQLRERVNAAIEKAREQYQERMETRLQERIERMENITSSISERQSYLESRLGNITSRGGGAA